MRFTISHHLLAPTSLPPPLNFRRETLTNSQNNWRSFSSNRRTWTSQTQIRVSSSSSSSTSDNQTVAFASSPTSEQDNDDSDVLPSASEVVRSFYKGINERDLGAVEDLIAEKCVYEDLIFPHSFIGQKAILEFFKKFIDSISKELQFAIDDISGEDSSAVGVTWHLEWRGKPFPFSKGCSFYRLEVINNKRQIIYGRDSVEPAIKPGEAALVVIKGVVWLLERFPKLADQP